MICSTLVSRKWEHCVCFSTWVSKTDTFWTSANSEAVRDFALHYDSDLSMKQRSYCVYHIRRLRQLNRHVGQYVTTRRVGRDNFTVGLLQLSSRRSTAVYDPAAATCPNAAVLSVTNLVRGNTSRPA